MLSGRGVICWVAESTHNGGRMSYMAKVFWAVVLVGLSGLMYGCGEPDTVGWFHHSSHEGPVECMSAPAMLVRVQADEPLSVRVHEPNPETETSGQFFQADGGEVEVTVLKTECMTVQAGEDVEWDLYEFRGQP